MQLKVPTQYTSAWQKKKQKQKTDCGAEKKTFLFGATVTLWFGDLIWCHLLAKMIVENIIYHIWF